MSRAFPRFGGLLSRPENIATADGNDHLEWSLRGIQPVGSRITRRAYLQDEADRQHHTATLIPPPLNINLPWAHTPNFATRRRRVALWGSVQSCQRGKKPETILMHRTRQWRLV